MKTILILIIPFLLFFSCSKNDEPEKNYPDCLQVEIDRILDSNPQSPRATIELYTYQSESVYMVHTNFPDDYSNLYNSKCELICSFGGIDGNGESSCADWESAKHIKTVWTDSR